MNTISAMFLSGWILMLPPVVHNEKTGTFETKLRAPYSQWDQFLAFDTAKECTNEKIAVYNAAKRYLEKQLEDWRKVADDIIPESEALGRRRVLLKRLKASPPGSEEYVTALREYADFLKEPTTFTEQEQQEFEARIPPYSKTKHAAALARLDARCVPSEVVFPEPKK